MVLINLFSLLKDEFKRAHGLFQQDGLTIAANYSILNFQAPHNEWKKVALCCCFFRLYDHLFEISINR